MKSIVLSYKTMALSIAEDKRIIFNDAASGEFINGVKIREISGDLRKLINKIVKEPYKMSYILEKNNYVCSIENIEMPIVSPYSDEDLEKDCSSVNSEPDIENYSTLYAYIIDGAPMCLVYIKNDGTNYIGSIYSLLQ